MVLLWYPGLTFARSFAFIGAFVSIFSLLIGPFFQQSVGIYNKQIEDASAVVYASYASGFNSSLGHISQSLFSSQHAQRELSAQSSLLTSH